MGREEGGSSALHVLSCLVGGGPWLPLEHVRGPATVSRGRRGWEDRVRSEPQTRQGRSDCCSLGPRPWTRRGCPAPAGHRRLRCRRAVTHGLLPTAGAGAMAWTPRASPGPKAVLLSVHVGKDPESRHPDPPQGDRAGLSSSWDLALRRQAAQGRSLVSCCPLPGPAPGTPRSPPSQLPLGPS